MKFSIVKSKFIEALKSVQNVVAGKGSLAILQNVLLEGEGTTLTLTTTDLDLSIKCKVECEIMEKGSTTLPVKLLFNAMTKAPEGIIEVRVDENEKAIVLAGSSRLTLNGKPASEFPKLSEDEESLVYTIPCQTLREMLRKTSYAAAQDDTRRTLRGVLMSFKDSKLTMVATDGRRLALVENEIEFPTNHEKEIVLPSKAVQELLRSLDTEGEVKLLVQSAKICLDLPNMRIFSKLIDDVYPNYMQVIPKSYQETVTIDRQLLLNALERASVMTMDEAHSTKLIFENNKLIVTSAANDVGEAKDEVDIKYAGERIEIMFNPAYVMDPLKVIDDDEITFNLNNGHSPAIIRCSIPFIYVIMPLRIN